MLAKHRRLRSRRDFQRAYASGRAWTGTNLAIRVRRNDLPHTRFGFVVGKRVGKAVVRNKVRRRLRAIARDLDIEDGWDVVVIARPGADKAGFEDLQRSIAQLIERAGLKTAQHGSATS